VSPDSKILAVAIRNKVQIRYGCGALRCGTCGIKVRCQSDQLSPMKDDEKAMLEKLRLTTDGTVRMACRTKILLGEVEVDLDFQHSYSPGE
jgi:ferredoxin